MEHASCSLSKKHVRKVYCKNSFNQVLEKLVVKKFYFLGSNPLYDLDQLKQCKFIEITDVSSLTSTSEQYSVRSVKLNSRKQEVNIKIRKKKLEKGD